MLIVATEKFRAFAEEVLRLEGNMVTGEVDPDQVKVLLGEKLDVWPASLFIPLNDNGGAGISDDWEGYKASY